MRRYLRYLIHMLLVLLICPRVYWSNGVDPGYNSATGLIDVVVNSHSCVYEWCLVQTEKHPIRGICLYPFAQVEEYTVRCGQDDRDCSFIKRDFKPIPAQSDHIYVFLEDKELPVVYEFCKDAQKNGIYIKELDVSIAVQKQTYISSDGEKSNAPLRIYTIPIKK